MWTFPYIYTEDIYVSVTDNTRQSFTSVYLCVYLCVLTRQAGASSMWASCCGLLNEVMGTGTVRAQQPGFGAGAGPFRFAPSAGYSTYPPTSSGSTGQLCKACGLAFSVFRRKVNKSCVGRDDLVPAEFHTGRCDGG